MEKNPHSSNQTQEMTQQQRALQTRKRVVKGVLIFSAVVILLSLLFAAIDPETLIQKWFSEDREEDASVIYFYDLDDPYNFLENEQYEQMDARLFVNNPFDGVTYSVEPDALYEENDDVVFFYHYFEAVKNGDAAAVAQMYADGCEVPEDFTVQMIYDITVIPQTEGGEIIAYRVDYKIYRNNGSFRDDVGSDTIRPLLFTLTNESGELQIKSVVPYTSYIRY